MGGGGVCHPWAGRGGARGCSRSTGQGLSESVAISPSPEEDFRPCGDGKRPKERVTQSPFPTTLCPGPSRGPATGRGSGLAPRGSRSCAPARRPSRSCSAGQCRAPEPPTSAWPGIPASNGASSRDPTFPPPARVDCSDSGDLAGPHRSAPPRTPRAHPPPRAAFSSALRAGLSAHARAGPRPRRALALCPLPSARGPPACPALGMRAGGRRLLRRKQGPAEDRSRAEGRQLQCGPGGTSQGGRGSAGTCRGHRGPGQLPVGVATWPGHAWIWNRVGATSLPKRGEKGWKGVLGRALS